MYCYEDCVGFPIAIMGNDFKTFSAESEWSALGIVEFT